MQKSVLSMILKTARQRMICAAACSFMWYLYVYLLVLGASLLIQAISPQFFGQPLNSIPSRRCRYFPYGTSKGCKSVEMRLPDDPCAVCAFSIARTPKLVTNQYTNLICRLRFVKQLKLLSWHGLGNKRAVHKFVSFCVKLDIFGVNCTFGTCKADISLCPTGGIISLGSTQVCQLISQSLKKNQGAPASACGWQINHWPQIYVIQMHRIN